MIDALKKYIDSNVNKKLKSAEGSFFKAGIPSRLVEDKEVVDYSEWMLRLVCVDTNQYIVEGEQQIEFIEFLNFELLYKQSIKMLVDAKHFIVNEALSKLGVNDQEIMKILRMIGLFDVNKLDYYELFIEEIKGGGEGNVLTLIQEKIDAIAIDSNQGSVISHSAKMTNPACKYPRLFVRAAGGNDGYIRTGNNETEFDLHINATKLKVFKFLSLKIDNKTILDVIRADDCKTLANVFSVTVERASIWTDNFKACVYEGDDRTHPAIKQIYFPVENSYHQLSVLQPSGLIFLLKQKIDFINDRSSRAFYGKKAKKDNQYVSESYSSVLNLTVTRHGGDHPKNISGLNNKHQSYYLLSSEPPKLQTRDIQFPTVDFFRQTFSFYRSKDLFHSLHALFVSYKNDWNIRAERDNYYQAIIDRIIENMWLVRSVATEQFNAETSQLNKTQKIWLCAGNADKRDEEDNWLDDLTEDIARYIFNGYEKTIGKKAFMFSDEEFTHIHKQVLKNKEALR